MADPDSKSMAQFKARLPIKRRSRYVLAAAIFSLVAGCVFLFAHEIWELGFLYLTLHGLAAMAYFFRAQYERQNERQEEERLVAKIERGAGQLSPAEQAGELSKTDDRGS